jgi:hypothetical protein
VLEQLVSRCCNVRSIAKTMSECGVQYSAEAIDDSNGHYRDTRSCFSAVDMGRRATLPVYKMRAVPADDRHLLNGGQSSAAETPNNNEPAAAPGTRRRGRFAMLS